MEFGAELRMDEKNSFAIRVHNDQLQNEVATFTICFILKARETIDDSLRNWQLAG